MKSHHHCLFAIVLLAIAGYANNSSKADTTKSVFPEKLRARPAWEYWISAPFWMAASPWIIYHKGVEKSIGYIDDRKIIPAVKRVLISKDETRVIMPTHSSPIGSGVRYKKTELITSGSELNIIGTYGLAHRHNLSFDWQRLQIKKSPWFFGNKTGYHYKADEAWYGKGPESDDETEADYGLRQFYSDFTLQRDFRKYFNFDILGGAKYSSVEDPNPEPADYIGNRFIASSLPGLQKNLAFGFFGLRINFDNRNRKGNTSKGWEITLASMASHQLDGDDFGFLQSSLDITKYIHLFYDRSIVLRLEGQTVRAFADRKTPFYALSELGTKETIRGFDRGRFHDRDRYIASIEYRYPIWTPRWRAIDAVLFADGGQVVPNLFTDITGHKINFGIGGGFRFYSEEDLVARVEIARSQEIWRFYFVLN